MDEKFMIYDDLLYTMYESEDFNMIREGILSHLKNLIPFTYASILIADQPVEKGKKPVFSSMTCMPASFEAAERDYLELYSKSPAQWLVLQGGPLVLRESSLLSADERLRSTIYRNCYTGLDVYDTLQASIVYDKKMLGVIMLYRDSKLGEFRDEEVQIMKSLDRHFNKVFYKRCFSNNISVSVASSIERMERTAHLTPKEKEIIGMIFRTESNTDICEKLCITEHTLQKHLQNIYRKMNICSRVELFNFLIA